MMMISEFVNNINNNNDDNRQSFIRHSSSNRIEQEKIRTTHTLFEIFFFVGHKIEFFLFVRAMYTHREREYGKITIIAIRRKRKKFYTTHPPKKAKKRCQNKMRTQ